MKGMLISILLFFFSLLHIILSEEEIFMQLDLFSNGKVNSIKMIGKAPLTDLPDTENAKIHKSFSGKPNGKLEIRVTTNKPIRLAAVLHVGTTVYSSNELTHWKDASNQAFEHLSLDASTSKVDLNGTMYSLLGHSGIYSNDLTYLFDIPDISYCSNVNSKGVVPINYVKLTKTISPTLVNYVYIPPVNLQLVTATLFGTLKDNTPAPIAINTPFSINGITYEGTKYGIEIIEYKIDSYSQICKFEIRVCFESCDECMGNSIANKKNELCTKCSAIYTKVSDTVVGNEFNCFLRSGRFERYYIDPKYDVFYRCELKCLYCSLKGGETIASCDECNYPNFIEKESTKECYTPAEYTTLYSNYYHDTTAKKYLPCDVACALCAKPGDPTSTNCDKCSSGYSFYEGIGDSKNCIPIKINNEGYILVGDTYKLCNIACKVCNEPKVNNCQVCSEQTSFISGTTYCTENSENQIVVDGKPYYKDPKDTNFYPCNEFCSSCLLGPLPLNHNCEHCITDYVFKEDENLNCFNKAINDFKGYYYDEPNNIYMKCFPICAECVKRGDEKANNCDTCVDGYSLVKDQAGRCIMKTGQLEGYYYNEEKNLFIKCYSDCKGCSDEGVLLNQKCLSCKPGLFLMTINSNCIDPEPISVGRFLEDITLLLPHTDPIKPLEMSSGDYKYILYPYSMQSAIDKYVPYLSFSDVIDVIKDYCSIADLDDLLIAQISQNNTKISSTQTEYKFYLKNGTEIDMSKLIQEKITFNATFRIVTNSSSINYDYAQELFDLGIDYYNPEDPFYNQLCISYSKGTRDMGLGDRRNIIFPKVKLCQQGCIYQEMIYSNYSVKCNCSFDKSVNDTRGFIGDDESSNNFILFKCYSMLNTIHLDSPVVITAVSLLALHILCTIWIIFTYFIPINAKINSIMTNPPRRKNKKELKEEEDKTEEKEKDKEEDNKEEKEEVKEGTPQHIIRTEQIRVTSPIILQTQKTNKGTIKEKESLEESAFKLEEKRNRDELPLDFSILKKEGEKEGDILLLKNNKLEIGDKELEESARSNRLLNRGNTRIEDEGIKEIKEVREVKELVDKDNDQKKQPNKRKSSLRNKGLNNINNNYIEEDNELNDKEKIKGSSRTINEKGDNSISSSIDLGFDSTGTKLTADEANIALFSEIEYECDSRRYWRHFFDVYLEKQLVFTLFKTDNMFYPITFRLLMFLFNISSLFFFNALLYSPSYLTKRLKHTESIDFAYLFLEEYDKALYSALLSFVFGKIYYLIYYTNVSFQRLYRDGKKNTQQILRLKKMHLIKLLALIPSLYLFLVLFYSFIFVFCLLYPNNITGLLYAFLMSFVFNFVIIAVTCTVISFARFIGIDNHLK